MLSSPTFCSLYFQTSKLHLITRLVQECELFSVIEQLYSPLRTNYSAKPWMLHWKTCHQSDVESCFLEGWIPLVCPVDEFWSGCWKEISTGQIAVCQDVWHRRDRGVRLLGLLVPEKFISRELCPFSSSKTSHKAKVVKIWIDMFGVKKTEWKLCKDCKGFVTLH